ncbi:MAG TPA: hypothetical protein VLK23_08255 [Thermodesulfobacteriota bacterium]|nr:hypothetical protein [Thermodesulfobacteriota bacterium]
MAMLLFLKGKEILTFLPLQACLPVGRGEVQRGMGVGERRIGVEDG